MNLTQRKEELLQLSAKLKQNPVYQDGIADQYFSMFIENKPYNFVTENEWARFLQLKLQELKQCSKIEDLGELTKKEKDLITQIEHTLEELS